MKLLLDTHSFIWWDSDTAQLSSTALAAVLDPNNDLFLSVVSIWEMVIKSDLGKLTLRMSLDDIMSAQLSNGIRILPAVLGHALGLMQLPPIHKDPFDRLLAAQAMVENLDLVASDLIIPQYPVRVIW